MTRSELVNAIAQRQSHLTRSDVDASVKSILSQMINELSSGGRIEIRGFGSFTLHHRDARIGRNPKTGEAVSLPEKYMPHFKPGKELKEVVDNHKQVS